jgi:hypothetical protein
VNRGVGQNNGFDAVSGEKGGVAEGIGCTRELGNRNHVGGIGWCGHRVSL